MDWRFFGTPPGIYIALVLAGLVVVMVAPGFLAMAFARLLSEVLYPLFVLAIIYLGYRVMFRGLIGGGGNRRR